MDEDVPGRGATPSGVLDAATIRRALGECMTLTDVDDAMGWPEGTARRRRWRDLAAGGLPPADAELGGVALWFRATISRWRAETAAAPPDAESGRVPEPVRATETRPEPDPEPDPEAHLQPGAEPEPELRDESEPDLEAELEAGAGAGVEEAGTSVDTPTLHSGFQLEEGQDVLAYVHGSWQPAVVRSRARRTVVVDYQVHPGALGARRQRVTIDRIRRSR
ncbi:hypothetical protein [Pseudonocardia sp. MH-G8]|uniref:hypothetical protein n=1 Tax=Pseudonocardia sp. MH-G8 TaxID=1854588 RepID=UPI000BA05A4A|nr:hypothetical protein [Pseudonocardia sp. MH-G8]OZM79521.1 hypothetical protein CFP66_25490 [Pseudonocardia sp. MH-G8]